MIKTFYFISLTLISVISITFASLFNTIETKGIEKNSSISGKLVTGISEEIVDNATVIIKDNGKVIAKTTVNKDGSFLISDLPNKNLEIEIENIAYDTYKKTLI